MTAFQMTIQPLKKYADFKGRAGRPEFWFFFLFVAAAQVVARIVDLFLGAGPFGGPVSMLAAVGLFVPQIAVTVRRLHDVNKSGKELVLPGLMLLAMPLVVMFRGVIASIIQLGYAGLVLLIFAHLLLMLIKKGSSIPNKYGASPRAFSFASA